MPSPKYEAKYGVRYANEYAGTDVQNEYESDPTRPQTSSPPGGTGATE